jgi:hypothetical protein
LSKMGKAIMILLALIIFSIGAMAVQADVGEPGSQSDPIVTKSYVDLIISNLREYVDSKSSGSQNFEIVYMANGEQLIAESGTEIILRSGVATVIDAPNGGLCDITAGKDLKKSENISQNHLLIVPRSDGRGVRAETDVVLMVRGNFTVGY